MVLNHKEIKNIIYEIYPYCSIFIADKDYYIPSITDIEWLLYESGFEKYQYHRNTFDCDDYSLILHAFIRQEQYRKDWKHPWAFGECWLNKYKGKKHNEAINISISNKNEILLINPQTDDIITTDPSNDNIYFTRM